MNHGITGCDPAWSEAQHRAETYLHLLCGEFGSVQRELLVRAMQTAHAQSEETTVHPVTLVMRALFLLLEKATRIATAPPMQRATMLPEKIEFPFHEGLSRLFRSRLLPFAGAN
jgi:hypothetical protein